MKNKYRTQHTFGYETVDKYKYISLNVYICLTNKLYTYTEKALVLKFTYKIFLMHLFGA